MKTLQESDKRADLTDEENKELDSTRQALGTLLQRQQVLLRSLEMGKEEAALIKSEKRLFDDKFRLLIIGELSRGKSTLLNALLRKELLAASAIPCPVINEIKWGEPAKALLYDGTGTAKEISVLELGEVGHAASSGEPYQKVELFWPSTLCRDGVELIEYPSLSHLTLSAAGSSMMDYLSSVDAVLLVLSCEALFSNSEAKAIENKLRPAGHEDIFFVCNRLDGIRRSERERIIQHGLSQLQPYTKSDKRIFFVSAVEALDGYLDEEPELIEKSGLPQLEAALTSVLANDRERVKIQRVIRQTKNMIPKARRLIKEREAQAKQECSGAEKLEGSLAIGLQRLTESRSIIVSQIASFSQMTQELIRDMITNFWHEMASSSKVDRWMAAYQMDKGAKITTAFSADETQKLAAELIEFVLERARQEWNSWQTTELIPLMAKRTERLKQQLQAEGQTFIQHLNALPLDMSQNNVARSTNGQAIFEMDIDVSHFAALQSNEQLANVPSLKALDSSDISRILLTAVAGGAALGWIGLNPILVIPASIGSAFFIGRKVADATVQQIKQQVGQLCSEAILKSNGERALEVTSAIAQNLADIQQAYEERMEQVIKDVQAQVPLILAEKQKEQEAARETINELAKGRQQLHAIEKELAALNAQFDQ